MLDPVRIVAVPLVAVLIDRRLGAFLPAAGSTKLGTFFLQAIAAPLMAIFGVAVTAYFPGPHIAAPLGLPVFAAALLVMGLVGGMAVGMLRGRRASANRWFGRAAAVGAMLGSSVLLLSVAGSGEIGKAPFTGDLTMVATIGAAYAVFRLLFDGCMEKIGLGAEGAAGGVSFARECAVAGLLALVFTGLVQGL